MPLGTVSLNCWVGSAAVSFSDAIWALASSRVIPERSGTWRNSGPSDTKISSGDPSARSSPAAGAVRTTSPGVGWSSLRTSSNEIDQSKSSTSATAASRSRPATSGIGWVGVRNSM